MPDNTPRWDHNIESWHNPHSQLSVPHWADVTSIVCNFLPSKVFSLGLPHIITDNIRAHPLPASQPSTGIASQSLSQYLYDQDLFDTSDVVPCPWWPTYLNLKSSNGKNSKTSWVAERNIRWLLWSLKSEPSVCKVTPERQWVHWGQPSNNKSNARAGWKYWVQCCCYSSQFWVSRKPEK